jgi:hypothetical protein
MSAPHAHATSCSVVRGSVDPIDCRLLTVCIGPSGPSTADSQRSTITKFPKMGSKTQSSSCLDAIIPFHKPFFVAFLFLGQLEGAQKHCAPA